MERRKIAAGASHGGGRGRKSSERRGGEKKKRKTNYLTYVMWYNLACAGAACCDLTSARLPFTHLLER